jgi:hypothetical protein
MAAAAAMMDLEEWDKTEISHGTTGLATTKVGMDLEDWQVRTILVKIFFFRLIIS